MFTQVGNKTTQLLCEKTFILFFSKMLQWRQNIYNQSIGRKIKSIQDQAAQKATTSYSQAKYIHKIIGVFKKYWDWTCIYQDKNEQWIFRYKLSSK